MKNIFDYLMLEKKLDSLLTDMKKIPCPPPSFTNKIVGV
jgi:hypothetical protein